MKLAPYQERVVTEKKDLDTKIKALTTFLEEPADGVDSAELDRMQRQLDCMNAYSRILSERIEAFGQATEDPEDGE